jgi:hypothetical protein
VQQGQAQALVVVDRRQLAQVRVVVADEHGGGPVGGGDGQAHLIETGGVLGFGGNRLGVDQRQIDHPAPAAMAHGDTQLHPFLLGDGHQRAVALQAEEDLAGARDRPATPDRSGPALLGAVELGAGPLVAAPAGGERQRVNRSRDGESEPHG